jgi:hypothetical protein
MTPIMVVHSSSGSNVFMLWMCEAFGGRGDCGFVTLSESEESGWKESGAICENILLTMHKMANKNCIQLCARSAVLHSAPHGPALL